ncbi:hypothetical protein LTR94_031810, partial [Friedmanniomyces endolithicus]
MTYSRFSLIGLAFLAACASGPKSGPDGFGPGAPGGPPPERSSLFVSPFGELFVSQAGEPYPVAAWFAGADVDQNGRLDLAEFTADGVRWFGSLDQDKDGVI